jgi:hypothetical protein
LSGYFLAGHAFKVAQDDDTPVMVGQADQLIIQHILQVAVADFAHARFGHAHYLHLTPPSLRRGRSQPDRRLPGHAVEPVGDGLFGHIHGLSDEDILGIVVVLQQAAADAPNHRGVTTHQSGKGVVVPAAEEKGQEFPVSHPATVRAAIGHKVLDDNLQGIGFHQF